jgi:hypothetical protein
VFLEAAGAARCAPEEGHLVEGRNPADTGLVEEPSVP